MSLVAMLKDAKEAHAAAEDFLKLVNSSIVRFESLAAGLDQEIARQEAFLATRKKVSEGIDLPLESLRKRRGNLSSSLETLRARVPAAELAFTQSTERLTELVNAAERTLGGQETASPATAEP